MVMISRCIWLGVATKREEVEVQTLLLHRLHHWMNPTAVVEVKANTKKVSVAFHLLTSKYTVVYRSFRMLNRLSEVVPVVGGKQLEDHQDHSTIRVVYHTITHITTMLLLELMHMHSNKRMIYPLYRH